MAECRRVAQGFTLVEVMVALAVVALALPALLVSLYQEIDATAHLRDKAAAHAVAANKLTELRLLAAAQNVVLDGSESGSATMSGRDWYWRVETKETALAEFQRVEVSVRASEDENESPLYTLVAFFTGVGELP